MFITCLSARHGQLEYIATICKISDVLNGTVITTRQEDGKDEDVSTAEDKDLKALMGQKIQQNNNTYMVYMR